MLLVLMLAFVGQSRNSFNSRAVGDLEWTVVELCSLPQTIPQLKSLLLHIHIQR